MSNPQQIKVGIINLNNLLKKYQPDLDLALVNESNEHGWTGKYLLKENERVAPTFDQLLNTCYHAMRDMTQFIKEHEEIKKNLHDLQSDAVDAHRLLMSMGLSVESLKDGIGIIASRFKQSLDVVYKASTIHPHGLFKFQAAAREFVTRFLGEKEANEKYGGETGPIEPPPSETLPKSTTDGEKAGGEDRPSSV